jgi:hypothetical protein
MHAPDRPVVNLLQKFRSRNAVLQQVFCSRSADLQAKCGFSRYTQRIFDTLFAAVYLLHNRISLHRGRVRIEFDPF